MGWYRLEHSSRANSAPPAHALTMPHLIKWLPFYLTTARTSAQVLNPVVAAFWHPPDAGPARGAENTEADPIAVRARKSSRFACVPPLRFSLHAMALSKLALSQMITFAILWFWPPTWQRPLSIPIAFGGVARLFMWSRNLRANDWRTGYRNSLGINLRNTVMQKVIAAPAPALSDRVRHS